MQDQVGSLGIQPESESATPPNRNPPTSSAHDAEKHKRAEKNHTRANITTPEDRGPLKETKEAISPRNSV